MMRPLLSIGFVLALTAPVFAADVANGEKIARRWCASCHVVSADQKSASADVPGFAAIAAKKYPTKTLATFLTDPHPVMPSMALSQPEIADIIAYIRTLGPPMPPDVKPEKDVPPKRPSNG